MPACVDKEKCTGCESCVEACPAQAISMDDTGKAGVDESVCTECGICVDECPIEAINMKD
ncbi:MAG: 4Fe-4S binding protein [Phycisphaerae bacterium]|jgi:Fe-S-cluster-containing hydrogenase component 2|nr:4Fe-4S binding protein [Phycisphaerae bacterium]